MFLQIGELSTQFSAVLPNLSPITNNLESIGGKTFFKIQECGPLKLMSRAPRAIPVD
jgi:hypothetical protein